MSLSMLTRNLRALGLAAAVLGSFAAQGVSARTLDTIDGPITVPDAVPVQTRTPLSSPSKTPAQIFLERSGATGGDGQHA
ncbi:hypothetical protein [Muricoccus aerilatus]|uniref:hypothetical protein n=1 Tax=Muricoccus aerilatus TaxID=452982 RepID=UPI0005C2345C|nr:hypothetical protein [Roseomonas aerilata]